MVDIDTTLESLSPVAIPSPMTSLMGEVLEGLLSEKKYLPPKLFYDARGSALFDRICSLEEYYPTRTEQRIMATHIEAMCAKIPDKALLVEYGSGSSTKTRMLLDHLPALYGYVPIDISGDHLHHTAEQLRVAYPYLGIYPLCADYTGVITLPQHPLETPVVVYFPGSTIGNFEPDEALQFLRRVAALVGPGGGMLIGVDLKKNSERLNAAYNDKEGVTAAFNKNMLAHMNDRLGCSFDLDTFDHYAFYNPTEGRIEMHLISTIEQSVCVGHTPVHFEAYESIRTEYSYKYTLQGFAALADAAGFDVGHVWQDERACFSVQYLQAR